MPVSPEVNEKLIEYLSTLESVVKQGGIFFTEQTPLVIQELILRERMVSTSIFLTGIIFLFFGVRNLRCGLKENNDGYDKPSLRKVFNLISGILFLLISLVMTCDNFERFLTCWVAPRVYLLEFLRRFH